MNFVMCSIYDSKAEYWSAPRTFRTRADALRAFEAGVNNKDDGYGQHPEDFVLFVLGEFNEVDGIVVGITPVVLEKGINLVKGDV